MHDPDTLAFHVYLPWWRYSKFLKGWRPVEFATIWHHDPEADGSDDSCGWSSAKLNDVDRQLARELVDWEQTFPHFFAQPQRVPNPEYPSLWEIGPGDASALMLDAWHQIAWRLDERRLTPKLMLRAMMLGASSVDHFRGGFANTDPEEQYRTMLFIIRAYRSAVRPWWQHPRWHVRHWRVRIRFTQTLKRWLFTRCSDCGQRFRWGETGIGTWHGEGPRWFRSEQLRHTNCAGCDVQPLRTPETMREET